MKGRKCESASWLNRNRRAVGMVNRMRDKNDAMYRGGVEITPNLWPRLVQEVAEGKNSCHRS